MSSDLGVRCVVVTPEKTELDASCNFVKLPMYDGEIGILPGRAPMVGRLGFGLMKLSNTGSEDVWYVDGGFVQVTREAVYVLTNRLIRPSAIDRAETEEDLKRATELSPSTHAAFVQRERALAQARGKLRSIGS